MLRSQKLYDRKTRLRDSKTRPSAEGLRVSTPFSERLREIGSQLEVDRKTRLDSENKLKVKTADVEAAGKMRGKAALKTRVEAEVGGK